MQGISICKTCGKEFSWSRAESQSAAVYCSKECYGGHEIIKCLTCEKEFKKTNSRKNKKFCSRKCKHNYGRIEYFCKTCGKKVSKIKASTGTHEYCSKECYWKVHRIKKICPMCKKEFITVSSSKKIHCSCSCAGKYTESEKLEAVKKHLIKNTKLANGCLEWTGRLRRGYGQAMCSKALFGTISTHRLAYICHYGSIPKGMLVLHRCDNKKCCNPDHLWLGNHILNSRDMVKKGRSLKGEKNHQSKLTEQMVKTIKEKLRTETNCAKIAREFGVHKATILSIKNNRTWKHVN